MVARAIASVSGLVLLAACSSTASVAPAKPVAGRCGNGGVAVAIAGESRGGMVNGTVTFTGKAARGCTLLGDPQLVFATTAGTDTGRPLSAPASGIATTVSISTTASAVATFSWATTPPATTKSCRALTGITVTPPALTDAITAAVPAGLAGSMVCTVPVFSGVHTS